MSALGRVRFLTGILNKNNTLTSGIIINKVQNEMPLLANAATQTRGVRRRILHKDVVNQSRKEQFEAKNKERLRQEIEAFAQQQRETSAAEGLDMRDMPVPGMVNPYEKPYKKCIICEHNVELDYKNTRLLSQFVSPYTGLIYGRQYTGLCQYMQRRVSRLIKRAQYFGFMPYNNKDPHFLQDPKLFDPFAQRRR